MVSGLFALALGAAGTCPGSDFEKFLAAFSDDVAIQRRYTALPLIHELIDADDGIRPVMEDLVLYENDISFPVMPSRAEQTNGRLRASIRSARRGLEVEVELTRADTDTWLRYRFRKNGDCWHLIRTSDDSLGK